MSCVFLLAQGFYQLSTIIMSKISSSVSSQKNRQEIDFHIFLPGQIYCLNGHDENSKFINQSDLRRPT